MPRDNSSQALSRRRGSKRQPILSAAEEQYVEEIAQRQSKYSIVVSDNALVFRADPVRMGAAWQAYADENANVQVKWTFDNTEEYQTHIKALMSKCDALGDCDTPEE